MQTDETRGMSMVGSIAVGLVAALVGCRPAAEPAENAASAVGVSPQAVSAVSSPASGASDPAALRPASRETPSLPADIVAFTTRRDACDHFRGEEPYDKDRAIFLAAEIRKRCTGTDQELAELRRRYAGDRNALAALEPYEDKIE